MADRRPKPVQGSLFEEDYLLRTLGAIARRSDVALTELVANAWDAGASRVDISVPLERGSDITIADDGAGMSGVQFRKRWMTLAYNRVRHQGPKAEFPPERSEWHRVAYGRNGVGRHGMLCFADSYLVETRRDGKGWRFGIKTASGKNPFVISDAAEFPVSGHGTTITARVLRNLPDAGRIRDVLAARFLHDPQFSVFVNGISVPLSEHTGLVEQRTLRIDDGVDAEAFFIDSTKAARTTDYQGIAFWVGGRLVGEPSWTLGARTLLDGRTRIAKRHTVVVRSESLLDEVLPDWTGFRKSDLVDSLYEKVADFVEEMFLTVSRERIAETKQSVLAQHRAEFEALKPLARLEVNDFLDDLAERQPMMAPDTLSVAVQAVINLEKSRSGSSLLEKLAKLDEADVEALDRLLSEWTVRDALTVLDEIDQRINVVEAIKKLSADSEADELHTLHPLLTQARWVFGPEFDSPEYASNVSLRRAVEELFGGKVEAHDFLNPRKRPDIVVLKDATLSAVATEAFDDGTGLCTMRDVLIIELKRGASEINRDNVNQADGYVQDLLGSGHLDGRPYVRAFVVGHRVSAKLDPVRRIGEPERARIEVATYGRLVRTAEKRLFGLRDRLADRYAELTGADLAARVAASGGQLPLLPPEPLG
jgi:hypothetical protein